MKFVAFNLVVGAALAYLLIADRGQINMPVPPMAIAAEPLANASSGEPVTPSRPEPKPPVAQAPPRNVPVTDVPRDTSDIIPRDTPKPVRIGAIASDPNASAPAAVEDRPAPPPPLATPLPVSLVQGPLMSAADRGRSLRDLARDMEGRFVTGVR